MTPTSKHPIPFLEASQGNVEAVCNFLRNGGDPNAIDEGIRLACVAAGSGSEPLVAALLAAGADPNAPDYARQTPLHAAARAGSVDVCKVLLTAGASVNAADARGSTPLDCAMQTLKKESRFTLMELLLGHGADPDKHVAGRRSPWQIVSEVEKDPELVSLLARHRRTSNE